ncbi:MAG: cyclic nucleotide-binding domain-containing protein, partial [Anaerolineae bacterium]|nr:cyclic nucleotide-binding domain-containing protein [Anaerolineae bacterium]
MTDLSVTPDFSLIDRLADLPYFHTLAPDRLTALAARALRRTCDPGAFVFGQDEPSAGLWIVERGRVKVFRLSADGR